LAQPVIISLLTRNATQRSKRRLHSQPIEMNYESQIKVKRLNSKPPATLDCATCGLKNWTCLSELSPVTCEQMSAVDMANLKYIYCRYYLYKLRNLINAFTDFSLFLNFNYAFLYTRSSDRFI
jgi:hypothetical protein